jgi:hypothetical protein
MKSCSILKSHFPIKINCFIVLFLSFALVCSAQSKWKEDVAFLKNELPKKHVNFFFQLEQKKFETELDALSLKIDEMNDVDIALSLQKIIAKAGDSHTIVRYRQLLDDNKRLPLQFYWFDDGIYVLSTTKRYEHLLGSRLEGIENHPTPEITDSLATLITCDNNSWIKHNVPGIISDTQVLSYFGFIQSNSSSILISFTDINGKKLQENFVIGEKTDNLIDLITKETPLFRQNPDKFFWDCYFDNGIYYVQYNVCMSKDVITDAIAEYGKEYVLSALGISETELERELERIPSFKDLTEKIFSVANEKPVKRFVFDMRLNGGGSSDIGDNFIQLLKKNEMLNKKGVLYVIIGRNTFSSAMINTMNFINQTEAITIGEETGAMPNHYGQVESFKLPNSGIIIQYSTKYFRYATENLNTITPNIKVEYNFDDYLNGIDPAMNAILNDN